MLLMLLAVANGIFSFNNFPRSFFEGNLSVAQSFCGKSRNFRIYRCLLSENEIAFGELAGAGVLTSAFACCTLLT